MIHTGDCIEVMAGMPDASVDAVVTDPPYGLGFMGKHWDRGAPGVDFWREMLRVAKPSAYLLSFAGTRTVHRIGVAIEDAGWIIRDTLVWAYASGFPKSKASLKPAWEPIVMARKPGPLRMLAIDECRIGVEERYNPPAASNAGPTPIGPAPGGEGTTVDGRWPANVILTDPIFDGDTPGVVGGGETNGGGLNHLLRRGASTGAGLGYGSSSPEDAAMVGYDDTGTYSRFFLIPKADRTDREPVVRGQLRKAFAATMNDGIGGREHNPDQPTAWRENNHPTVKPVDLMRHLVRLVTPPGGVVLDPFLGSGTTAIACELEGFDWIGIEREAEYVAIAEARLNGTQRGLGLSVEAV